MAKLPENKRLYQIKDLGIGETAYVSVYALRVDQDEECYLLKDYAIFKKKNDDNAQLKIKRVKNGFIAFILDINYHWGISDDIEYTAGEKSQYLPIIGFGDVLVYEKLSIKELRDALLAAEQVEDYEEASKIRNLLAQKK
ncbi:hypothetical protein IPJ63_00570 [Candidatus Nomurabacteria bacterium]|nr:MAG: hypothetical protein IPJ63_00570 [Candidatus Nomurabacteria bacterium]